MLSLSPERRRELELIELDMKLKREELEKKYPNKDYSLIFALIFVGAVLIYVLAH